MHGPGVHQDDVARLSTNLLDDITVTLLVVEAQLTGRGAATSLMAHRFNSECGSGPSLSFSRTQRWLPFATHVPPPFAGQSDKTTRTTAPLRAVSFERSHPFHGKARARIDVEAPI